MPTTSIASYLEIKNQGRLVGVFPSVLVKRQQQILLSQPFVEYGGPLCSHFTRKDYMSLGEALLEAARVRNCESVLIRGGVGAENLSAFKHCSRTVLQHYGELHLERTKEDIWQHHLSQKARNAVRSASKSGLRCEIHRGANAVQPPFYHLYLRSMKRLSVPPHSPRFFEALAAHLSERLVSCWVYQGQEPLAVILGGITARRLHCIILASDERAWPLHPNDLIHWNLIEWAFDQGIERLDLGSASSTKQLDFKRKWGAEMHDYARLSINASGQLQTPEWNREHVLEKKLWNLPPAVGIPHPRSLSKETALLVRQELMPES